jgi:osmoprotectant transport system permease protein
MGVLGYLQENRSTILGWLGWHAWLSAVPTVLGLVLAIPLGWLARRSPWLYPPIVTTAGLLYTIPSLALFVMLPGILRTRILDPLNVVVALTVYTVALLVRVVADGLAAVPSAVVQAATAMGYRRWQRLLRVELPLAVPVIAAGVRVAAVSNVSLVSVAAIIGVPELGQLFTNGFQLFETAPILLGIVGCVLLAGAFDAVVVVTARLLTPWLRVAQSSVAPSSVAPSSTVPGSGAARAPGSASGAASGRADGAARAELPAVVDPAGAAGAAAAAGEPG